MARKAADEKQQELFYPRATGNTWQPAANPPASVPVPLPIVMVRVEGPFTALDRKLWLLLLHNAWEELEADKPYHEISVAELIRLFRQYGRTDLGARGKIQVGKGEEETEAAELWNSIRRLVKTTVEWEDEDYQGISALIGEALLSKRYRDSGKIYYSFGKALSQQILAPRTFARLRCHVILSLRSKYAVTLYEILESFVNRRDQTAIATIEELREWLKVKDGAYSLWKDFRRNVLDVALEEINAQYEYSGFTATYEGLRTGRSFDRVKFTLTKTTDRESIEKNLQSKAIKAKNFGGIKDKYLLTEEVKEEIYKVLPRADVYAIEAEFKNATEFLPPPLNPQGAFIGWVRKNVDKFR